MNTFGNNNTFVGINSGQSNTLNGGNTFVGANAGNTNTIGFGNTVIGFGANVGANNLSSATAIGSNAIVTQSNAIVLGSNLGSTRVGIGTSTPADRLTVQTATTNYGFTHTDGTVTVGSFVGGSTGGGWYGTKSNHSLSFFTNGGGASLTIDTNGLVNIPILASAGGLALCRNGPAIAFCSSSLRYKKNIGRFTQGMSFVNKLQPISFDWKKDGTRDVGFGAEDIAKIDERFVTYNDKGEVEGVKYDRLSVAFVNAFKEQQAEISSQKSVVSSQQKQIETLQQQIDALKALVCSQNPTADVCRPKN